MENRFELNKNLAQMLKGGVIMDVTTPEQAKIAEAAGACAVMALERIPADIRAKVGITDRLVRLSVGIEDAEDSWRDVDAALRAASTTSGTRGGC